MKTLLLTGATGFIGSNLRGLIRRSGMDRTHQVVCLAAEPVPGCKTVIDRRSNGLYGYDRRAYAAAGVARIDYVVHLGAFIPKVAAELDAVDGAIANVVNTRHLVETLPNAPQRIVFASSVDVYAPASRPVREEDPCCPRTLYGHSKLFGEAMLTSMLRDRYRPTSLQILRIGHTYGPGEAAFQKFIPQTIRRLLGGQPPHFTTTGGERRAFIHVEDCCRMIMAALACEPGLGPIIVASRKAVPLIEVANDLCATAAELLGTTVEPTFDAVPSAGEDIIFDVAKMELHLGRERMSLSQGLREEFESFARRRG